MTSASQQKYYYIRRLFEPQYCTTQTLKEEQKRKLRVFEMSVLRKICGITGRDRRPNSDVMEELAIEKDIVQVLQTRRPTYFGHVNRMRPCASIWSYTWSPTQGKTVMVSAHASLSHPSRHFGARDWIACCDVKL